MAKTTKDYLADIKAQGWVAARAAQSLLDQGLVVPTSVSHGRGKSGLQLTAKGKEALAQG